MKLFQYVSSDFTRFVDPENIIVDTKIVIPCQLQLHSALISILRYKYVFLDDNCMICEAFITIPNLITIYKLCLYNVSKLNLGFNIKTL